MPPELPFRRVPLPSGGSVRVAHEPDPTGRWVVLRDDRGGRGVSARSLSTALDAALPWPETPHSAWSTRTVEELTPSRESGLGPRFACPCCDQFTLTDCPPGTYATCAVCGWEDCGGQYADLDLAGGPNRVSLREARANVARIGISDERDLDRTGYWAPRAPLPIERAGDDSAEPIATLLYALLLGDGATVADERFVDLDVAVGRAAELAEARGVEVMVAPAPEMPAERIHVWDSVRGWPEAAERG